MLNTLSQKFHAWTTGWRVLLLLVADALMMGYIMPLAGGLMALAANASVMPLDLMFFYTPDQAFAMIEKYGEAGRDIYMKIELTADIIYPIIYTLFYGLLLSWLFQRGLKADSPMQKYNVMPVGAWFFDLLENIGIVSMLSMYPAQPSVLAWLTMMFGSLKWLSFLVTIGLVLFGLVRAAINGFRKQV
ncbi:MAG TPA: hypothetical protein VFR47_19565 [Anaerolineales bacterium]|nr:hypothetical protein [Anaerolineales bacterium]